MNQIIQEQPIQNQSTIQQPIQGQPIQGQPIQGQPIQGQPIQGQPMGYGQPLQSQGIMYQQPISGQGLSENQQYSNQPMQGYVPPQMGGRPKVYVENPLEELRKASKALVIQEEELLEILTGIETPNRYHVYVTDSQGNEKYLFKCKEESNLCERICCASERRGFIMKIKHIQSQMDLQQDFSQCYAELNKPFKCTCCCCNRPELTGSFKANGASFGSIRVPYNCCSPLITCYDKDNINKWKLTTECCQCGFGCRKCPCGQCSDVGFRIYDASDNVMNNHLGQILRKSKGLAQLISDADNYQISFPPLATPEEKLLLISATLMIDYQYFENNDGQNKRRRNHHHY